MRALRPRRPLLASSLLISALLLVLAGCKRGPPKLPETTNSIGITMVDIPGGTFTMGEAASVNTVGGHNTAYPAHAVTVAAFQLAKTEVTFGQFKKFLTAIGTDGHRELQDTDFLKYNNAGDDAPAVNLSPRYAFAFIEWLNATDGGGYRLPSETEWEYACRAGGSGAYCGGDDLGDLGWYGGNSGQKLHPAAQKKPNAFGLYDMSGNAEEWVGDCWHSDYHGAPADGSAWDVSDRSCKFRPVRGGSWAAGPGAALATRRDSKSPVFRHHAAGIRVARSR